MPGMTPGALGALLRFVKKEKVSVDG